MDRDVYFKEMESTTQKIIDKVKQEYSRAKEEVEWTQDDSIFIGDIRLRNKKYLLRPHFTNLAFKICGGRNFEKVRPVCVCAELYNISTYEANSAFDNKWGADNEHKKNKNYIMSIITMSRVRRIIKEIDEYSNALTSMLDNANKSVYKGQYIDTQKLTTQNDAHKLSSDRYHDMYIERCRLLGGEVMALCLGMGSIVAEANRKVTKKFIKLGRLIGTAGQIVNDVADCIPTSVLDQDRDYKEQFSDFKNGRVTLPIYNYMNEMGNDNLNKKDKKHIIHNMDLGEIKGIIKEYYNKSKKLMKTLPKNHNRDVLSIGLSHVTTNKYFSSLRESTKVER